MPLILVNASFTDVVRPNADTLYSSVFIDLNKEPLVLQVPPISDRYYTLQFLDAYTNNFMYIGTLTNVTSGSNYLISGPDWKGTVPSGMTEEIKSPTNFVWIVGRILINGPQDVSNVRLLQDKLILSPLSIFGQNTTSSQSVSTETNTSKQVPVGPQPVLIPKTGITIYDEISKDMTDNPPYQYDSDVISKFKLIGIGSGLKPSQSKNETITEALKYGIERGEGLIDEKVKNLGTVINGWAVNMKSGNYSTDYLLRAGVAKTGLGANIPEEAVYPITYVDGNGTKLTGAHKYVLHFDKNLIPPVDGFWSITMYNSKDYFVDNPLNRYVIGDRTPGLKYNNDGSLDIFIQHDNPRIDRESNWLPAPPDTFSLVMRLYVPHDIILKGEYQVPPVQMVGN